MSIGKSIRSFRLQKELSLIELAGRCGITTSYLSSVERGIQSNLSIGILKKIARGLDVPVGQLINNRSFSSHKALDDEWTALAHEAMQSGISKQQFKEFLYLQKWRKMN